MLNLGNCVAWIFPIIMLAIVAQVVLRKAGHNQAWLDDAQWWMYGFTVLTAFGYAITTESHVPAVYRHHDRHSGAVCVVVHTGWRRLRQPQRFAPSLPVEDKPTHFICRSRYGRGGSGGSPLVTGYALLHLETCSGNAAFFVVCG